MTKFDIITQMMQSVPQLAVKSSLELLTRIIFLLDHKSASHLFSCRGYLLRRASQCMDASVHYADALLCYTLQC